MASVEIPSLETKHVLPAYRGTFPFPVAIDHGDYETATHLLNRMIQDEKSDMLHLAVIHLMKKNVTVFLNYVFDRLPEKILRIILNHPSNKILASLPDLENPDLVIRILTLFLSLGRKMNNLSPMLRVQQMIPTFILAGNFEVIRRIMMMTQSYNQIFEASLLKLTRYPTISHESFRKLVMFVKEHEDNTIRGRAYQVKQLHQLAIYTGDVRNVEFTGDGFISNPDVFEKFEGTDLLVLSVLSSSPTMFEWVLAKISASPGLEEAEKEVFFETCMILASDRVQSPIVPSVEMFRYLASRPKIFLSPVCFGALIRWPFRLHALLDVRPEIKIPVVAFATGLQTWNGGAGKKEPLISRDGYGELILNLARRNGIDFATIDPALFNLILVTAISGEYESVVDYLRPLIESREDDYAVTAKKWLEMYDFNPEDPGIDADAYDVLNNEYQWDISVDALDKAVAQRIKDGDEGYATSDHESTDDDD